METGFIFFKFALYVSLAVVGSFAKPSRGTCDSVECPTYNVIVSWNGYEIREYNTPAWMSTGPIPSLSIIEAAKSGFQRLSSYTQGDNKSKTKMNKTAPVIIERGKSAYFVSFYLPKKYQTNPPKADDLMVQSWKPKTYVAVRQFGGFLSDIVAKNEVDALMVSLQGSKWSGFVEKSKGSYLVASYSPPYQVSGRMNEIMVPFVYSNRTSRM